MFIHLLNEDSKRECVPVAHIQRVVESNPGLRLCMIAFTGGWVVTYQATYATVLELIAEAIGNARLFESGRVPTQESMSTLISNMLRPR